MSETMLSSELFAVHSNLEALASNEYPGRIAMMGIAIDGDRAFQVYALMGRSEGSRNRIFTEDERTWDVRTTAPDKTADEMAATKHAELIYYPAIQERGRVHVMSNGAQTTPVLEAVLRGEFPQDAVREAPIVDGVDLSSYEPDKPNYTPRITGILDLRKDAIIPFSLFVAQKAPDNDDVVRSEFFRKDLTELEPGVGYTIQTYNGNAPEGEALPSFDREEPYVIPFARTLEETAHLVWSTLNSDNRVALVAKSIGIESGDTVQQIIINAKQ